MSRTVVCIVGPSGGGKTLVAEGVIRHLSARGYRIGAVKHTPHGYRLDAQGKDSDRMRAAGATRVAVASPDGWAVVESGEGDATLDTIAERLGPDCDLVVAEGFRASAAPKVLVAPERADAAWQVPDGVVATVSDQPQATGGWRCGFGELDRLAERIGERFLDADSQEQVTLTANGRDVKLGAFAESVIASTLRGMVSSLKGVPEQPSDLRLVVRRRPSHPGEA